MVSIESIDVLFRFKGQKDFCLLKDSSMMDMKRPIHILLYSETKHKQQVNSFVFFVLISPTASYKQYESFNSQEYWSCP